MNLFRATEFGTIDECRALLENGADVNKACEDFPKSTPLILAAKRGRYDICQLYLNHGADHNVEDLIDTSAIEYASHNGHEEVVKLLEESCGRSGHIEKCNNNRLHEAARKGDSAFCLVAPGCLNVANDMGDYPIHVAARMGHTECVVALVNAGSDANQISGRMGECPLHIAAEYGNLETCFALLEMGADIESTDGDYHTPLLYAANARRMSVCYLLLERGACPTGHPEGGNPLEYAQNSGYPEIIAVFEKFQ